MVSRVIISFASHVLFTVLLLFILPPSSHFISLSPVLSLLMDTSVQWLGMNCEHDPTALPCAAWCGAVLGFPNRAEAVLGEQTGLELHCVHVN